MDPIFEEMRLVKVDRETGVTIRADVWQRWQNTIKSQIQPELNAARQVESAPRARQREAR